MVSLCPSCGQRLPKQAARCPACGASTSALPVETAYEPVSVDPLVTIGGGGKKRRGWLLVAALIVSLGVGALIAGRATDEATSTATTTTTSRPTTTTPPTTQATSTTPRSTTTTQAVTSTGGAVLPEPTGESLYTINATGDVYRVDLDTGSVTHSSVSRAFQDAAIVALDDGALVLNQFPNSDTGLDQKTVMYHVRVDGSVEEVTVSLPSAGRIAAPGIGVWLYGVPGTTDQTATLVTADGETAVTLTLPPGAQPRVLPDGDGIAFVSGSGVYRLDEQGIRRIATGELIAMSDRFVVASDCDAVYQCTVTRTDRTSGHVDTIGPRPIGLSAYYGSGDLSPDGGMVSMVVYGNNVPPTVHVYDLSTNTVRNTNIEVFGMPGGQAWTASGWSASVDDNSDVVFVRGDDTRVLDLPSNSSGPRPLAIAVGPTPPGAGVGSR